MIMGETNPSTAHWTMKASFPTPFPKLVDSKYVKLLTVYIFAYGALIQCDWLIYIRF